MTYTRDEIMSLDAAQLRLAIAEAKGYDVIDPLSARMSVFYNPHNWGLVGYRKVHPGAIWSGPLPDWPASIAAAWELVDEMDNSGLWQLSNGDGDSKDFRFDPYWSDSFDKGNCDFASDNTAPLAICRAWLMWKSQC